MSDRVARCPTCQGDRPVDASGRCVVCCGPLAAAQVEKGSALVWHLRRNATGYAALLLFGLATAMLYTSDLPQPFTRMDARVRLPGILGSFLALHWIHSRLVG